jgi:anaerobic magnesium-protoporphyrin IX monomethyl ester cyclase
MPRFGRALLINPPTGLYRRDDRCQNQVRDQTVQVILPPLDLAYMAAILRSKGVSCIIRDFPAEGGAWSDLAAVLRDERPDLLVFKATAPTLTQDMATCRLAREVLPEVRTLAFGAVFIERDREVLEAYPDLDFIIRGEGEPAAGELVTDAPLESVNGLTFRDGEGIVQATFHAREVDFEHYPLPARDLLRNELYRSPDTLEPLTVIQTSRGCPYSCIFCPAGAISERKVHQREASAVADEVEVCVREHDIRYFLFNADTFTINRHWVHQLCDDLLARNLEISWAANSRADTVDRFMLEAMKRAGCRIVGFGVESGDDEMLRLMRKDITTDQIRKAVQMCQEVGLRTHTFFIIGLPWETRETLARTEAFLRELAPDFFDINIAFPLPATEYERMVRAEGLVEGSIEGLGYADSPVRSRALSHDELLRARRRMLLSLYLRPRYIVRTLWREAQSPGQFLHLVRYGLRRVWQLLRQKTRL